MKYANVLLIAALAWLTACDKTDETINPKVVEEAKRVAQKGVVQLGDAAIRVLQEHNNKQNENTKHGWPTFDTTTILITMFPKETDAHIKNFKVGVAN